MLVFLALCPPSFGEDQYQVALQFFPGFNGLAISSDGTITYDKRNWGVAPSLGVQNDESLTTYSYPLRQRKDDMQTTLTVHRKGEEMKAFTVLSKIQSLGMSFSSAADVAFKGGKVSAVTRCESSSAREPSIPRCFTATQAACDFLLAATHSADWADLGKKIDACEKVLVPRKLLEAGPMSELKEAQSTARLRMGEDQGNSQGPLWSRATDIGVDLWNQGKAKVGLRDADPDDSSITGLQGMDSGSTLTSPVKYKAIFQICKTRPFGKSAGKVSSANADEEFTDLNPGASIGQ